MTDDHDPENTPPWRCPTPQYHETHRYCPSCTWTEDHDAGDADQVAAEDPQHDQLATSRPWPAAADLLDAADDLDHLEERDPRPGRVALANRLRAAAHAPRTTGSDDDPLNGDLEQLARHHLRMAKYHADYVEAEPGPGATLEVNLGRLHVTIASAVLQFDARAHALEDQAQRARLLELANSLEADR